MKRNKFIVLILIMFQFNSFGQKPIDTLNHFYVYNDKLQNQVENFRAGFVDTFTFKKNHYRCYLVDELLKLEYFENKEWKTNFDFPLNKGDYSFTKDFNNDGYPDFSIGFKWTSEVHLFNPVTNKFQDEGCIIYENATLIDSLNNIFCDIQEYNQTNDIYSYLYTYKNCDKILLYKLKFIKNRDAVGSRYKNTTLLFKYLPNGHNKFIKEIVFDKSILGTNSDDLWDFDYISFWTKTYKSLLGCR